VNCILLTATVDGYIDCKNVHGVYHKNIHKWSASTGCLQSVCTSFPAHMFCVALVCSSVSLAAELGSSCVCTWSL